MWLTLWRWQFALPTVGDARVKGGGEIMIGFLRGKILQVYGECCLLDVGGVGYRVFASTQVLGTLMAGAEFSFFIHTSVREDAIILYGFAKREEYEAFQLLLSVSGIGPKGALAILSATGVNELYAAIGGEDVNALKKLPGVGKKSAERLVLELKDKVGAAEKSSFIGKSTSIGSGIAGEAAAALTALGYSQGEIAGVAKDFAAADSVQEAIKMALKQLGRE